MSSRNLLVVNDRLTNLVPGPPGVFQISNRVLAAGEHGGGDLYVREWDLFGLLLRLPHVVVRIGENLESILLEVLGVVKDVVQRGAIGAMG